MILDNITGLKTQSLQHHTGKQVSEHWIKADDDGKEYPQNSCMSQC